MAEITGSHMRVHVIISGRVQGVWFRVETQKAARQYGVYGWVRNMTDGRVEAVFEGTREQVEAMLKWCQKGAPLSRVDQVEKTDEAFTGEFDSFEITY